MLKGYKFVRWAVKNNPLHLLALKDKTLIEYAESFLPYSIGIEIECFYKPQYLVDKVMMNAIYQGYKNNILSSDQYHNWSKELNSKGSIAHMEVFKTIPDIMAVQNTESEQRYRIPKGIKGLICLYRISKLLKQHSIMNPLSGIHYHVDMTDVWSPNKLEVYHTSKRYKKRTKQALLYNTGYKRPIPSRLYWSVDDSDQASNLIKAAWSPSRFNEYFPLVRLRSIPIEFIKAQSKWILKAFEHWKYTGTYNSWNVALNCKGNAVNFTRQHYTMEVRIGEMTFDYKLLAKRIINCCNVARVFKKKLHHFRTIVWSILKSRSRSSKRSSINTKKYFDKRSKIIKQVKEQYPNENINMIQYRVELMMKDCKNNVVTDSFTYNLYKMAEKYGYLEIMNETIFKETCYAESMFEESCDFDEISYPEEPRMPTILVY